MNQLLWKELRDLRGWLAGGLGLAAAFALLLATDVFGGSFVGLWMQALMPMSAAAAAIGIGVAQVARERHARTLDFLLVRPVTPQAIVWTKFVAGSAVLAALVAAAVALAYAKPQFLLDTGLRAIREQVSLKQLLLILFPRFWCLYALSLAFSVLVDRSLKAAALAGVLAVALIALAGAFADLAPFSGFVFCTPFFDGTGGLIEAARSARLSSVTGGVYAALALLIAATAAGLLQRSPERYLGTRGLAVSAAAIVIVAVVSAEGASVRLPELAPAGVWQLPGALTAAIHADDVPPAFVDESDEGGIAAHGSLVAVVSNSAVRFVDFSDPAHPRLRSTVELPLWQSLAEWSVFKAATIDDAVLVVGQKKALPVDEVQIAIVHSSGSIDAVPLGPVRPSDYYSVPVPVGPLVYLGVTHGRVCSLRIFDPASHRELAPLALDRMRPPAKAINEGAAPVRIIHRGNYLYLASPSFLTTVDVADPAAPRIADRLPVQPKADFLYGFPRPLGWQGQRLFETRYFPQSVTAYDLSDPAHPHPAAEFTDHGGLAFDGDGRACYRPWRSGVLEFQSARDGFQALRYLHSGSAIATIALSGDWLYALTAPTPQKPRTVQAFRIAPSRGH